MCSYHPKKKLDQICLGKLDWLIVCQDCLNDIQEQLSKLKKERKEKIDENKAGAIKIDKDNVFIIGKNGPGIKSKDEDGKVIFKSVKPDLDFSLLKEGKYNLEEIVIHKIIQSRMLLIFDNAKPQTCGC